VVCGSSGVKRRCHTNRRRHGQVTHARDTAPGTCPQTRTPARTRHPPTHRELAPASACFPASSTHTSYCQPCARLNTSRRRCSSCCGSLATCRPAIASTTHTPPAPLNGGCCRCACSAMVCVMDGIVGWLPQG
jgi:hypothetical protein